MNASPSHDWSLHADTFRDARRLSECLKVIEESDTAAEWDPALDYIESCCSDLGVPSSAVPPMVRMLSALVVTAGDAKRTAILSLLEELTCGRGIEIFTPAQRSRLAAARGELGSKFDLWVAWIEAPSEVDAIHCVDLVAYAAEADSALRKRATEALVLAKAKRPSLAPEVDAVRQYFE